MYIQKNSASRITETFDDSINSLYLFSFFRAAWQVVRQYGYVQFPNSLRVDVNRHGTVYKEGRESEDEREEEEEGRGEVREEEKVRKEEDKRR